MSERYVWLGAAALAILLFGSVFYFFDRRKLRRRQAAERARLAAIEAEEREERERERLRLEEERRKAALVELLPPPEGNVLEVPSESTDLDEFPDTVHIFPDRITPITRFEELNWRLFVASFADTREVWPETSTNDFPTRLTFKTSGELATSIAIRLRPKYPVIVDRRGWWAASSSRLEMSPDDPDLIADLYLSMPAERRPVVVSYSVSEPNMAISFYRYGFQPFHLFESQIQPYPVDALRYIFDAFTGDRNGWKWFSIARMRQHVLRTNRRVEEQVKIAQEKDAEKKRVAHANRFAALWDTVERPAIAISTSQAGNAENSPQAPS